MNRLVAGAAAVLLAAVGCVTATASASSGRVGAPITATRVTLTAAAQSLTSSTGKHLRLSVSAIQDEMTVGVVRRGSPESHSWTFALPDSGFGYDDDGTGMLRTGSAIEPFGRMSLSVTATGRPHTVGCGRARTSVSPVAVKGTLQFNTRSTGTLRWGRVGGATIRSFTGHSTISVAIPADTLCPTPLPTCVSTITWEAHNIASDLRGFTQMSGTTTAVSGSSRSALTGTRLTYLSSPAGATRTDATTLTVPRPSFAAAGDTAALAVPPSKRVELAGAARLASTSENQQPALACGSAGPNGTRTVRTDWTATYRNGRKRLVLSQQIDGSFALHDVTGPSNRANATIERIVTTTGP